MLNSQLESIAGMLILNMSSVIVIIFYFCAL